MADHIEQPEQPESEWVSEEISGYDAPQRVIVVRHRHPVSVDGVPAHEQRLAARQVAAPAEDGAPQYERHYLSFDSGHDGDIRTIRLYGFDFPTESC
ncbi:hypothetical protein KCMC57_65000 (plasmid) [Kitasatospora sp. CMC57]|uniref:UbiC transcription regulator-associated domain-containing protein n=1 Tax=Kitasatospora sp. CMC57 TaxID=3231513 RepID=A0AB33K5U9_9ACTN